MAYSKGNLSFASITLTKYIAIDVLLYLQYDDSLEFLFNLNRHTREFLKHYYVAIKSGFENEGLTYNYIDLYFETSIFETFRSFEKLISKTL